jgi:hypothetical protein
MRHPDPSLRSTITGPPVTPAQADIRAKNAAQHTKLQAARMKALAQQLAALQGLPDQLTQLCDQTAALQAQLARLSALVPPDRQARGASRSPTRSRGSTAQAAGS